MVSAAPRPAEPTEYLRRPYARVILPESDGTFRGEIIEFPGCIASGQTAAETLSNLEEAANSWILAAQARGQNIPEPVEASNDFSGRLALRLPRSLHKKATWVAEREGVSLNQFIVVSLAEAVGEYRSIMNVYVTVIPSVQSSPGYPATEWKEAISLASAKFLPTTLKPVPSSYARS
jgi:predicted HicB family RNase H-like nuclease